MDRTSTLTESLRRRQNADGGWGYYTGSSWTEPTALAILALMAEGSGGEEAARGLKWLKARQRTDGGWAPNDVVAASTSVTSWCALALGYAVQRDARYDHSVAWVLGQSKPDYSLIERLVARVQRVPEAEADAPGGAPWYPDTAAWVGPSVVMILALRQAIAHGYTDGRLPMAIERAQRFLLARRCKDGGWNHGGTHFRSPNSSSYPEMTGMALLAFAPGDREIQESLTLAKQMAQNPPSCEAQAWLRMTLARHERTQVEDEARRWHSTRELALQILSLADTANPLIA